MKRLLLALLLLIALLVGVFLWLGARTAPSTTENASAAMPAALPPPDAAMGSENMAVPESAPPATDTAPAPPDRFIVCPGDPRCPPRQNTH